MLDIESKIIAYHEEANDYRLCLTREEITEIKQALSNNKLQEELTWDDVLIIKDLRFTERARKNEDRVN